LNSSNSKKNTKGQIYYYPWLKLRETITLDTVHLVPYPIQNNAYVPDWPRWVFDQIKALISTYLNRNGQPLSSFTVIEGPNGPLVLPDDTQTPILYGKLELSLNLMRFIYRDYDTGGHTGLQLSSHKAEIEKGRNEGCISYRSWFNSSWITSPLSYDQIKTSWPIQLLNSEFDLLRNRIGRISEIFKSIQILNAPVIERIRHPLDLLQIACSDSSTIKPYISVSLLAAAFEHLFNPYKLRGNNAFSFILNYLWGFGYRNYLYCSQPFESKQIKSVTEQIKKAKVTNPSIDYSLLEIPLNEKKTWLQTWFLDFHKLRNDFLHGNPWQPGKYGWSITQHCRVASEILPMTILIMLNRSPAISLPLTVEEKNRINKVDLYVKYAQKPWFTGDNLHVDRPSWLKGGLHPALWDSIP